MLQALLIPLAGFLLLAACGGSGGVLAKFPPAPLNAKSLYNASDDVISLTAESFQPRVFGQPHATLVEFYNAFCGFCQRYAPHWKEFATDVRDWRGVVQVAAIDCANDQNSALCREYEIMGYPTLRFFGPHFNSPTDYGIAVKQTDDITALRTGLAELVRNVSVDAVPAHWPQLNATERPLAEVFAVPQSPGADDVAPDAVFVIYEPADSWIANEIALDVHRTRRVRIVRVHSASIAETYGLQQVHSLAVVNRALEAAPLTVLQRPLDRTELRTAVQRFVREHGLAPPPVSATSTTASAWPVSQSPDADEANNVQATIAYVKAHEPTVYMADIAHAVWYTLGHEIPQFADISGDRLEALKRYVAVLSRYVPLTASGPELLRELAAYALETSELRGEHFLATLHRLQEKWELSNVSSIASQRWIGCQGSAANRRGYTCGLWTLFHFITAQAANAADVAAADRRSRAVVPAAAAGNPLETLQAIHGYVKHFFGCSDCSQHFQRMATERHIWSVGSADEAVLWLWRAHNEVNARLAGDAATEDAQFPKVQYPAEAACERCRNGSDQWSEPDVLQHLRAVYASSNASYYGVEAMAYAAAAQPLVGEKRMLDNVFSDLDMRMGMLLYLVCIGMMVVAVKMFMRRRSYHKKMYTHDFLGKV